MVDDLRARVARAICCPATGKDCVCKPFPRGMQAADAAIAIVREECASERYATNQPLSSFAERFACKVVAADIRKLGEPT